MSGAAAIAMCASPFALTATEASAIKAGLAFVPPLVLVGAVIGGWPEYDDGPGDIAMGASLGGLLGLSGGLLLASLAGFAGALLG